MFRHFRYISFLSFIFSAQFILADSLSLADIDGSNGYVLTSTATRDNLGEGRMHGVGDFNGDGIDDFVVGTSTAPQFETDLVGKAYLVYGKSGTTFSDIDLNTLESGDGSQGFLINGVTLGDGLGEGVGGLGDVNGDGLDDFIVAGHLSAFDRPLTAYVVYGFNDSSVSSFELSQLVGGDGSKGFTLVDDIYGIGDNGGSKLAGIGDVNGDGHSDIIIGSEYATNLDESVNQVGRAYVYFGPGNNSVSNVQLSDLLTGDGSLGFALVGKNLFDFMGASLDGAGDFNGDGVGDVVVAATGSLTTPGNVYVVYGGHGLPVIAPADMSADLGFTIAGENDGDNIGSVAGGGDFNSDNLADIVIGDSTQKKAYVIYGNTNAVDMNVASLRTGDGSVGFEIESPNNSFGRSVSFLGDTNDDGIVDIAVGSRGGVHIIYGADGFSSSVVNTLDIAAGSGGLYLFSATQNSNAGRRLASAGDINADGVNDILIGAPGDGRVYAIFGGVNLKPSISQIENQRVSANSSSAELTFTINDPESAESDLVVTVSSSNVELFSDGSMVLSGSDAERNLVLTPTENLVGQSVISLTVADPEGKTSTSTFSVEVIDTTPPEISLTGASSVVLTVGDSFTDPGATAIDAVDGDLTSSITITGTVDTSTVGTYTLVYSVFDAAQNLAQAERSIQVNAAPVTPPPAPSSGGGGGGSTGLLGVLMLLLFAGLRLRTFNSRSNGWCLPQEDASTMPDMGGMGGMSGMM